MLHKIIVAFTILLIACSAIAEILFPSNMLAFVGIDSNLQTDFLLQTTAVALLSFLPSIWSARNEVNSPAARNALIGIAIYMFLSSLVDYQAFTKNIVNQMSIPSIVFRCILGLDLLWLSFRKSTT
jgi:hypothetical protein